MRRALAPLSVFALSAAAFLPALGGKFLTWDDYRYVAKNAEFLSHGWRDPAWMLTSFDFANYHPLTWLAFGIDYALWGLNPAGFHLTNLLLHALGAVLFFFACLRLLKNNALAAAFAALLFSVHPLRAESVAWISERKDVLSGLFALAALLAYLKATDARAPRTQWLAVSCIFYAASLLSKTVAVTFPAVLLVLDVYVLRRRWRDAWLEKIPFAALAVLAAGAGMAAQNAAGAVLPYAHMSLPARLCQAAFGLGFYLYKTVLPFDLSPMYDYSRFTRPGLYAACAALAAGTALSCWRLRAKKPWLWAAFLAYALIVFPMLGFVKTADAAAANRYSYLSCLPWAALAGGALSKRTAALGAAIILVLAGTTWRECGYWRDSVTLWSRAVAVDPGSPFAHYNLALALEEAGRRTEARTERRLAEDSPARPFHERGEQAYNQGDFATAAGSFAKAVEIAPALAATQNDLGLSLYRLGRFDEAAAHFEFAVRLSSGNPAFEKNLAAARARLP